MAAANVDSPILSYQPCVSNCEQKIVMQLDDAPLLSLINLELHFLLEK